MGHLSPDLGMLETRSRSWKTLLLAPAAFIAVVYNPDKEDTEDPTADRAIQQFCKVLVASFQKMEERKEAVKGNNNNIENMLAWAYKIGLS